MWMFKKIKKNKDAKEIDQFALLSDDDQVLALDNTDSDILMSQEAGDVHLNFHRTEEYFEKQFEALEQAHSGNVKKQKLGPT